MANAHQSRSTSGQDEVNLEIDDTQNLQALNPEGHQPPVVVLSLHANLEETVKNAGPRGAAVATADSINTGAPSRST